jgi:hypothetical protein
MSCIDEVSGLFVSLTMNRECFVRFTGVTLRVQILNMISSLYHTQIEVRIENHLMEL